MPLNLSPAGDSDFLPYLKYNAKAGRWYIKQDGVDGEVEITNPTLAFDMANIKTGWIYYMEGVGPEKVWDPAPGTLAPKPAGPKNFKRGFEVVVHGHGNIGVREFSATAGAMITPVLQMYDEYEKAAPANPGKVPVFACTGVKPITGKHGTNYSPVFRLQSWVPRSSIPFDSNSHSNGSTNGHVHWATLADAVTAAAPHGITREALIAGLKARGANGWMPSRDQPFVEQLIRDAQAMRQRQPGDEFETIPAGNDEIPW